MVKDNTSPYEYENTMLDMFNEGIKLRKGDLMFGESVLIKESILERLLHDDKEKIRDLKKQLNKYMKELSEVFSKYNELKEEDGKVKLLKYHSLGSVVKTPCVYANSKRRQPFNLVIDPVLKESFIHFLQTTKIYKESFKSKAYYYLKGKKTNLCYWVLSEYGIKLEKIDSAYCLDDNNVYVSKNIILEIEGTTINFRDYLEGSLK